MKKVIALAMALVMVLSLSACMGTQLASTATSDQASAKDISTYDKDLNGLVQYIADSNSGGSKAEIYYDIVGADGGSRYIFSGNNAYVEIYDFTSADNDTAKAVIADIKDDGKFRAMEGGTEMTAVFTDSGNFVIAWDETRSYDYAGKAATDAVKANW